MNYLFAVLIVLIILNCTVAIWNHTAVRELDVAAWFPAGREIIDGRRRIDGQQRIQGMRSQYAPLRQLPIYQPEEHYQHDIMYMEVPNERQRLREAVNHLFPSDDFTAGQTRLAPVGQFLPSRFEVDMEGISAEVIPKNTSTNYAKASGFVNRTVKDGYTDRVGYDI